MNYLQVSRYCKYLRSDRQTREKHHNNPHEPFLYLFNVFKIFPKSYCVDYFWDLVIIFRLFIFFLLQNFEELFIKEIRLQ